MPGIDHLLSVSCGVVNRGAHRMVGSRTRIRMAINARLEEVSFRTGMATGAITLLALAAATAAVVVAVMPGHGSSVNGTAGAPIPASSPVAAVVPVAAPSLTTPSHRLPGTPSARAVSTESAAGSGQASASAKSSSASAGSGSRYDSAGEAPQGSGSGQGAHGGHWHEGRNGGGQSPFDRTRGDFPGGFWRPAPQPGRM
jgi:hypothetical protein